MLDGHTVDLDETASTLGVSDGDSVFLKDAEQNRKKSRKKVSGNHVKPIVIQYRCPETLPRADPAQLD